MSRLADGPEFDLIRVITSRASATHPLVQVGPGDDCTMIGDIAISVDASVENVHFRRAWIGAEEIGWRATAAALSDLAAVAAEPVGVLVTLVVPEADRDAFIQSVMRGAIAAAESVGAALLGGDITAGATLVLDVVAAGRTAQPVLRSGACPGDEIWVTGKLGGAAAAVAAWEAGAQPAAAARTRYARVEPRIEAARWLVDHIQPTALIDISDGLYGDVAHLAAASGCCVTIHAPQVPVDEESGATFSQAVTGGEDYELCFTAGAGVVDAVRADFERTIALPLTRVGVVSDGSGVFERAADGRTRRIERGGYQHFRDGGL